MYYWQIGFDDYAGYLNSHHWVNLRKAYWHSGQSRFCRICEKKYNLILHHRTYETLGKENIWKDVVLLCKNCHQDVHFLSNSTAIPLNYKELYKREQKLYKYRRSLIGRLLTAHAGDVVNRLLEWILGTIYKVTLFNDSGL